MNLTVLHIGFECCKYDFLIIALLMYLVKLMQKCHVKSPQPGVTLHRANFFKKWSEYEEQQKSMMYV